MLVRKRYPAYLWVCSMGAIRGVVYLNPNIMSCTLALVLFAFFSDFLVTLKWRFKVGVVSSIIRQCSIGAYLNLSVEKNVALLPHPTFT